jgi:hypothetical protein
MGTTYWSKNCLGFSPSAPRRSLDAPGGATLVERGIEGAGTDAVDVYVELGQLQGQRHRELDNAGLGYAVAHQRGELGPSTAHAAGTATHSPGRSASDGRNVNYLSAFLLYQMRHHCAGHKHRSLEV